MTARTQLDGTMLADISSAIVRIYKEHYGKGPTRARTIYAEDTVIVRLEDVLSRAEQTLVRLGRGDDVRTMRRALQMVLESEFIEAIERLTGRRVVAFLSDNHVSSGMAVELFFLEPSGTPSDPSAGRALSID